MGRVLYGDCVTTRDSTRVRISGLAHVGCELEAENGAPIEGDVALWIGAIGPIDATSTRRDAEHYSLRFKEELDGRILEHFNCG